MFTAIILRFSAFMATVVSDGGPSVTRWVYLRTSEVISFGWFGLVIATVYRFVRFGTTDGGMLALIGSLAAALFAATTLNQNTKLALDAKSPGNPSSVSTIGATVTSDDETR